MTKEQKRELAKQALSDRISSFGSDTEGLTNFLLDCFFMTDAQANQALLNYATQKKAQLEALKTEAQTEVTTKVQAVDSELTKLSSVITELSK